MHGHLHDLNLLGIQPVLKDLLIRTNKGEGQDLRSKLSFTITVNSIDFLQTAEKYFI